VSVKDEPTEPAADTDRIRLRADCGRYFGLCCVAPAFAASTDFAIDKAAGQPCPHLQGTYGCDIHHHLRQEGFRGCAVYDCFGAGQQVAQVTFGGRDWRQDPQTARQMFEVFGTMRQLHELVWYLIESLLLRPAQAYHGELSRALGKTARLADSSADALVKLDIAPHRRNVGALLRRTSELVRAEVRGPKQDHSGADLIGAHFSGADLRGANLRGACLIGADLRRADLRVADLMGADLRDADLGGADLTETIFLTQSQLDAAKGDAATTLPPMLSRPTHWSPSGTSARCPNASGRSLRD
jgi:uncharacterized protein YjbI with pentapeptide repeats